MTPSIHRLLPIRAEYCVTITQPLRPTDPDRDRVRIELRHAIEAVDAELETLGMQVEARRQMLVSVRALCEERPNVPRDGLSLIALLTPANQELHVVDWALPARTTVADRFALGDLIAAQSRRPTFFALALCDASARLLRSCGNQLTEVMLPLERADRAAANLERVSPVPGGSQHANTHGAGMSGSPMMTAQGFGHEDRDAIERGAWYFFVNRALETVFATFDEPIVLIADVVHHHAFRSVCKVSNLQAEGVEFNPINATDAEIVKRAAAALTVEDPAARFETRGDKPHAETVADVIKAARTGQVETLFFVPERPQPGVVQDDGETIKVHAAREAGDIDLVSEAIRLTLKTGGEIVAVDAGLLADSTVYATLRWDTPTA
ncbi:MAG: hypothetical protein ACI9U2_000467 [Bradymonadia bacterium]|jgi:hypothetical protein